MRDVLKDVINVKFLIGKWQDKHKHEDEECFAHPNPASNFYFYHHYLKNITKYKISY
jgi:hypothetical protein